MTMHDDKHDPASWTRDNFLYQVDWDVAPPEAIGIAPILNTPDFLWIKSAGDFGDKTGILRNGAYVSIDERNQFHTPDQTWTIGPITWRHASEFGAVTGRMDCSKPNLSQPPVFLLKDNPRVTVEQRNTDWMVYETGHKENGECGTSVSAALRRLEESHPRLFAPPPVDVELMFLETPRTAFEKSIRRHFDYKCDEADTMRGFFILLFENVCDGMPDSVYKRQCLQKLLFAQQLAVKGILEQE